MSKRNVSWLAAGVLVAVAVSVGAALARRSWPRERREEPMPDTGREVSTGSAPEVGRDAHVPQRPLASMRFLG